MVKFVGLPLHEQIAGDLRHRIATGELPVGAALPTEAELQARWRGSRGPVRQALAALRMEGLIGGGRGKPPTVRRSQLSQPFDSFLSFSRWAVNLGRRPGQQTVEIARRQAGDEVAGILRIPPRTPVVQLVRLRLLDGEPVMVERTSLTTAYGESLFDHDPDDGSIYAHLISRGLEVGGAHHVIDAVLADATDAELLDVAVGGPLLRERRTAFTVEGDVFEYSDDRYRPDRVTFTIANAPDNHPALDRSWNAAGPTSAADPGPDPTP